MVHIIFDPSQRGQSTDTAGSVILQSGDGGGGISYFQGLAPYQRGYGSYHTRQRGAGIGDIFRRFWRVLKPIAKSLVPIATSAGKALGEEGLATTARVLNDVVQGGTLKDVVAAEGRQGVQNLLERAQKKLGGNNNNNNQSGGASKKSANRKREIILKPTDDFIGRLVSSKKRSAAPVYSNQNIKKRLRFDNLGYY